MVFSTTSVKQDFFMYLYQDLNRHPSTIDGYRTAIVVSLGPAGLHISQTQTLTSCPPVFTGIDPNVPETYQSGTFLLY